MAKKSKYTPPATRPVLDVSINHPAADVAFAARIGDWRDDFSVSRMQLGLGAARFLRDTALDEAERTGWQRAMVALEVRLGLRDEGPSLDEEEASDGGS